MPNTAPSSGDSAKVAPPSRPRPIAYPAQATLASAVNSRNRCSGSATDPDVMAVAVRPPGRNRPTRIATAPYRSSAHSAFSLATASLPFVIRLPAVRPSRYETRSPAIPPATTTAASATRFGEPVAESAPRPITTASDGMTGMNPSIVTATKTIK
jgi:hypothetical protein